MRHRRADHVGDLRIHMVSFVRCGLAAHRQNKRRSKPVPQRVKPRPIWSLCIPEAGAL